MVVERSTSPHGLVPLYSRYKTETGKACRVTDRPGQLMFLRLESTKRIVHPGSGAAPFRPTPQSCKRGIGPQPSCQQADVNFPDLIGQQIVIVGLLSPPLGDGAAGRPAPWLSRFLSYLKLARYVWGASVAIVTMDNGWSCDGPRSSQHARLIF